MKANRKFKEEEAVSAVIGVILMVAITVAIAATVYVYVAGFGQEAQAPEAASFTAKVVGADLKVTYASGENDVSEADIQVIIDGTAYTLSGANGHNIISDASGTDWDPGDYVAVTASGLTNPCPVTVVVKGTTVLDTTVKV